MLPIRDNVPSRRVPVVTYFLILVNILVFIYEVSLPTRQFEAFMYLRGIVPLRYTDWSWADSKGFPPFDFTPFVTHMFLHGGILHLVSNMWILWIFGDNVEDRMGPMRFTGFYVSTGLAAAVLHLLTNASSKIPVVGASGAIAGVLGAYFVLYPLSRVVTVIPIFLFPLIVEIPAFAFLLFWFWIQFYSGALSLATPETAGGVAWWAHVGGFAAGFLLHRAFINPRIPPPPPRRPRQYTMRNVWRD